MRHADLARDAGVGEVLVAENGDVVELDDGAGPAKAGARPSARCATSFGEELSETSSGSAPSSGAAASRSSRWSSIGAARSWAPPRSVSRGVLDPSFAGVARKVQAAVARAVTDCDPRAPPTTTRSPTSRASRPDERSSRARAAVRPSSWP